MDPKFLSAVRELSREMNDHDPPCPVYADTLFDEMWKRHADIMDKLPTFTPATDDVDGKSRARRW